jgi:hypothetical protein
LRIKPIQSFIYISNHPLATVYREDRVLQDNAEKFWDPNGKLVYQKDYQDGQELPDSEAVNPCLDRKVSAFKSSTDGDNFNTAMRDAWEAECKEGNDTKVVPTSAPQPSSTTTAGNLEECTSITSSRYMNDS